MPFVIEHQMLLFYILIVLLYVLPLGILLYSNVNSFWLLKDDYKTNVFRIIGWLLIDFLWLNLLYLLIIILGVCVYGLLR